MRVGIATDHGGFSLKEELLTQLRGAGHEIADYGAYALDAAAVPWELSAGPHRQASASRSATACLRRWRCAGWRRRASRRMTSRPVVRGVPSLEDEPELHRAEAIHLDQQGTLMLFEARFPQRAANLDPEYTGALVVHGNWHDA